MARPKKQPEEVLVEGVEPVVEVVAEAPVAEVPKFPYKFKHPDYSMTLEVVSESTDAGGRTVLHTADGCAYTASKA